MLLPPVRRGLKQRGRAWRLTHDDAVEPAHLRNRRPRGVAPRREMSRQVRRDQDLRGAARLGGRWAALCWISLVRRACRRLAVASGSGGGRAVSVSSSRSGLR